MAHCKISVFFTPSLKIFVKNWTSIVLLVVFAVGRPATPNLLQSSSGCGPTVQLGSVSDWFLPLKMGLTLSSVFGRLFGKKQMRILMGKDVIAFFLIVARDILLATSPLVAGHKW